MRKTGKIMTMIVFVATTCGIVRASSPATHMYIGSQTFDIWQTFDSEFYDALNSTNEFTRVMTRKYYYIGLTLPDLFNTSEQSAIREVINVLWNNRDALTGPLWIYDYVHDNVQQTMEFVGTAPNGNPS